MPSLFRLTEGSGAGLAAQIGALRAAVGVAALARPAALPRLLGADRLTADRLAYLAGMLGARDLALGVGTVRGARRGSATPWLTAGIACDAADAVYIGRAVARGEVNRLTGAVAGLSAVGGVALGVLALRGKQPAVLPG